MWQSCQVNYCIGIFIEDDFVFCQVEWEEDEARVRENVHTGQALEPVAGINNNNAISLAIGVSNEIYTNKTGSSSYHNRSPHGIQTSLQKFVAVKNWERLLLPGEKVLF